MVADLNETFYSKHNREFCSKSKKNRRPDHRFFCLNNASRILLKFLKIKVDDFWQQDFNKKLYILKSKIIPHICILRQSKLCSSQQYAKNNSQNINFSTKIFQTYLLTACGLSNVCVQLVYKEFFVRAHIFRQTSFFLEIQANNRT